MDWTAIGIETPLAIVLVVGITTLWKHYVASLKVNQEEEKRLFEEMGKISDNNKELIEFIRDNQKYIEPGKWWIKKHKPHFKLCEQCKDYDSCPHPNKPAI